MKTIAYLLIIALIGYFFYTYVLPARANVISCVDTYKQNESFRSVLDVLPKGDSGEVYCTNNYKNITNLDKCVQEAKTVEKIPGSTQFWYAYNRLFSTKINSIKFYKQNHNELCADYKHLLFRNIQ